MSKVQRAGTEERYLSFNNPQLDRMYATQGDTGRTFIFTLLDGDNKVMDATNTTLRMVVAFPEGKDEVEVPGKEDGTFTVTLTPGMTSVHGEVDVQLTLIDEELGVSTTPGILDLKKNIRFTGKEGIDLTFSFEEFNQKLNLIHGIVEETENIYQQTTDQATKATLQAQQSCECRAESERLRDETQTIHDNTEQVKTETDQIKQQTDTIKTETAEIRDSMADVMETEEQRRLDENKRKENETERQQAEEKRKTAETARETAEEKRASAETAREESENTRETNETARESAEKTRKTNETARETAESTRETNETTREENEQSRITTFNDRAERLAQLIADLESEPMGEILITIQKHVKDAEITEDEKLILTFEDDSTKALQLPKGFSGKYADLTGKPDLTVYEKTMDDVNAKLDKKANEKDVTESLGKKAEQTYVDEELGKKANADDVARDLEAKADKKTVNTALDKKADTKNVDTALKEKIDLSMLTFIKNDKTYIGKFIEHEGNPAIEIIEVV